MAPINKLCQFYSSYPNTTLESEWIYLGDVSNTTLLFFCNNNCDLTILYSIDEIHDVVFTETYLVVSNDVLSFTNKLVKTRYMKIRLDNIVIGSRLQIQGFYYA